MIAAHRHLRAALVRLRGDRRGVALLEFAFILPILLTMALTGAELTNYVVTRMRVSQLALHIADNAARMGTGTLLSSKKISETDINDLLTGAGMQSAEMDLYGRGRVILSDLEPVASPNPTDKYKIVWQRCRGGRAHPSGFGTAGQTNLDGIGPSGRQVKAQDYNATMFVEVYYEYQPIVGSTLAPSMTLTETASMAVRDRRDLTQVYNTNGATASGC